MKVTTKKQMSKPLFEERADRTLDKVRAVYAQRGGEYADTWRTCRFLAMKATAKKLGLVIPDEYCRALATAAFYDMKYERLSGGYKDDSVIDAIAYGSFWIDEMVDLDGPTRIGAKPEQQYRILESGELLQAGDEINHPCWDNEWIKAVFEPGEKASRSQSNQYRRQIKPGPEQEYRILEVGERIEDGDEFKSKAGGWRAGRDIGHYVTESDFGRYRRPINPQENAVR